MKLRYKATGEILEVPDAFAQANPGLYESPETTKPTATQPQTLQSQAGGMLMDILKSAASPFVKTGQNILTAGQEAVRASGLAQTEKVSSDIVERLKKVNEQLMKEKDPKKKKALLDESRKISSGLSDLTQLNQKIVETNLPSQLVRSKEDLAKISTLPGAAEEIARNTAGIMSYAINPTGGGITSQILKSAAQGGLMSASEEGAGVQEILGGSVLGGALGGVLGVGGKLFGRGAKQAISAGDDNLVGNLQKIAKETRKSNVGQKIASVGQDLREGVLQPSTGGGLFHTFEKGEKNALQRGLNLEGNSSSQLKQLGNQGKFIESEIKKKLPSIKTQVTKKTVTELLEGELKKQVTVSEKKSVQQAVSQIKKEIAEIMKGGSTTAEALYKLKSQYGDDLLRAFKKEATGGQLTAIEEVKRAAFNALKKSIDVVDPTVSQLNTLEHKMFQIASDLVSSERGSSKMGGDILTSILRSKPIQSLSDVSGRTAIGVGDKLDAILRSPVGRAADVAVGVGERFPAPLGQVLFNRDRVAPQGMGEVVGASEFDGQEALTTEWGKGSRDMDELKKTLQLAAIYDLSKNKGAKVNEIKMIMDLLDTGAQVKKTDAERMASDTGIAVEDAIGQLSKIKSKVGIFGMGTKTAGLLSGLNMADQDMLDFATTIANIRANISKARAGTALTPTEERMLDKYTPNEGDSYQALETKLKWLKKNFGPKIIK